MDKRKNNGGQRPGAGRKKSAETNATTSMRLHTDSMKFLRSVKYPITKEVNNLLKKTALRLKKSKLVS